MSEVTKEIENILLDKNFNLDNYDYQYILNLIKNNQNYFSLQARLFFQALSGNT